MGMHWQPLHILLGKQGSSRGGTVGGEGGGGGEGGEGAGGRGHALAALIYSYLENASNG